MDESDTWSDEVFGQVATHNKNVFIFGGRGHGPFYVARLFTMLLAAHMPEEGLTEAVSSLRDIFDFYTTTPKKTLPSPTTEAIQAKVGGGRSD